MRNRFVIGDETFDATLLRRPDGFRLQTGESEIGIGLRDLGGGAHLLEIDGTPRRVWLAVEGETVHLHLDGRAFAVHAVDALEDAAGEHGGEADTAIAPMPGTVIAVETAPGRKVEKSALLMTIESMKMETAIKAWRDGVVKEVHYDAGQTFDRGAQLVTLEPQEEG